MRAAISTIGMDNVLGDDDFDAVRIAGLRGQITLSHTGHAERFQEKDDPGTGQKGKRAG